MQIHIVQRGSVLPLIEMLGAPDVRLREMSAFALGRLTQVIGSVHSVSHHNVRISSTSIRISISFCLLIRYRCLKILWSII